MTAADYYDWWPFSGTALGMDYPGETFDRLHAELSRAGANVVIASRFLAENPDGIDVGRWRLGSVFGPAAVQVARTAEAMDAIGAAGVARAVREGKDHRPVSPLLERLAGGGEVDKGEVGAAIAALRESLRSRLSVALGRGDGITPARPTEGVEPREEVARLLEAYASDHREDLTGDVARYGDPRQAPGFDRHRTLEERAERSKTIGFLRYQDRELPGLRSALDDFRAAADAGPPDSAKVQNDRKRVMNDYANYAKHPPEELTAGVRSWLRDVEAFRDARRDIFHPPPTDDARVNARLAAIGRYGIAFFMNSPSLTWHGLPALACDWAKFSLHFEPGLHGEAKPGAAELASAFEALADAWEALRPRIPEMLAELRQHLIDGFRASYADQLSDDELPDYRDDDGEIADEKILEAVEGGSISLLHAYEEAVRTEVHFAVRWDEEHGIEVNYDADGQIERWF